MNAAVSHCAALGSIPRSFVRRGRATPMIVSFRITTKAETSRRVITSRLRAPSDAAWSAVSLAVEVTVVSVIGFPSKEAVGVTTPHR